MKIRLNIKLEFRARGGKKPYEYILLIDILKSILQLQYSIQFALVEYKTEGKKMYTQYDEMLRRLNGQQKLKI